MPVPRYYYQWWNDAWQVFDRQWDGERPIARCIDKHRAIIIRDALNELEKEDGQQQPPQSDHGDAKPQGPSAKEESQA